MAHAEHASGHNYLNHQTGLWSWLTSVDHKRICLLYLYSILAFFFAGGIAALFMRYELAHSGPSGLMTAAQYNRLFTTHGIFMIFLFIVPGIPATMGNFLIPLMIGAKDVTFPRLNLLSWYVYVVGAIIG